MKLLLACLFLISIVGFVIYANAATKDIPSKEMFVAEVREVLKDLYPETPFYYDIDQDTLAPPDNYDGEDNVMVFLGNIYNKARNMPKADRLDYVRDFLNSATQSNEFTSEELKSNLYVRARTKTEISMRPYLFGGLDAVKTIPAIKPFGEFLVEIVKDDPEAVRMIDIEALEKHKLKLDSAFDLALSNLLDVTPTKPQDIWRKVDKNIWVSSLEDDYDAVRLIAMMDKLNLPFKGEAIAFMPAHAVCLIASTADVKTLERMIALGNQLAEEQRPLSQQLWQYGSQGWMPWTPKKGKEAKALATMQTLQDALYDHQEQGQILDHYFAKQNKDIYVAKLSAYQNDVGDIYTSSVFIGGETLLPKTDVVSIVDESRSEDDLIAGQLIWEEFEAIIEKENLVPVPDMHPIRYDFTAPAEPSVQKKLIAAAKPLGED